MDPPIGWIPLRAAVDIVGRKLGGSKWHSSDGIDPQPFSLNLSHPEVEHIITMIAEGCETGEIPAAYRSHTGGAHGLDRGVWQLPCWQNYFATGTINLDLPLLDEKGRPNANGYTAWCTREIFVRRPDLDCFVAALPGPPLAHTNLRYPSDEPLIREALQALADGKAKKPLQAAKLVYLKAQGPSPETNLERLRKLIASEWKASPKIAKSSPTI
jgi:hypothetical protein